MCFVRRYASAVKKVETHIIQQEGSRLLSMQIVSGAAVCPNGSLVHQKGLSGLEQNLTGDFLMLSDGRLMKNTLKHHLLQLEITANPHSGRLQRWP